MAQNVLGWDNISPDVQILGIDLSPVGESKFSRIHRVIHTVCPDLEWPAFLQPWTEMSRKYLGTDKCIFRGGGVVQESIYDFTSWLLAWRCHRQRRHDVVLWTTKTKLNSDYLLKIKAWETNNQSLHSGMDKGIPSSGP